MAAGIPIQLLATYMLMNTSLSNSYILGEACRSH